MEFYYQDQLRWSFGFDNPNKTAAFIAALLPWFWLAMSFLNFVKQRIVRKLIFLVALVGFIGAWWLLFKSFSRGGIVAGLIGFFYIGWKCRDHLRNNYRIITMVSLVIVGLFFYTSVASRSALGIVTKDRAVANRFAIWKGGLEMVSSIPQGVGRGRSGEYYMQWFQPLEETARYRTLVNSYLTFTVEQGLPLFGLVILGVTFAWLFGGRIIHSSAPASLMVIGAKASLLTTLVAGFFTTTLEEPWILVSPLICLMILCAFPLIYISLKIDKKSYAVSACRSGMSAVLVSSSVCVVLYSISILLVHFSTTKIAVTASGSRDSSGIIVEPKADSGKLIHFMSDDEVSGPDYGKLVRQLAIATNCSVFTGKNLATAATEVTLGKRVNAVVLHDNENIVLIAPASIKEGDAKLLLHKCRKAIVFLPGFDEDGRVSFWSDMLSDSSQYVERRELAGVGTDVSSAWPMIVDQIKSFLD